MPQLLIRLPRPFYFDSGLSGGDAEPLVLSPMENDVQCDFHQYKQYQARERLAGFYEEETTDDQGYMRDHHPSVRQCHRLAGCNSFMLPIPHEVLDEGPAVGNE